MSYTVGLVNGKYITIDEEDCDWVELEKWRWISVKTNNDVENIYIESTLKRQRYLHNLFFPRKHPHAKIEFANGDPFDYRRENLFKISYYTRKRYRSRYETIVRVVKIASVGIIQNRCVIAPTNLCHRSFLCSTCATVSDSRYEACLNIAAAGNWPGWEVTQKGRWCKKLQKGIEEAKLSENSEGRM